MDLPPASYAILVGLAIAAWLGTRRWGGPRRRFAASVIGALIPVWVGLALLYYDRLLCWPLVVLGAAWLGLLATRRPWGLLLAIPALVAGIAFQALEGIPGFIAYFGVGLPIALLVPLAAIVARLARDTTAPSAVIGAALVLGCAALVPFSSFAFGFLKLFEVAHAIPFVLLVAGLLLLTRPGKMLRALSSTAEYEGRAGGAHPGWLVAAAMIPVATMATLRLLPDGPEGVDAMAALIILASGALTALGGTLAARAAAGLANRQQREAYASTFAGSFSGSSGVPREALVAGGLKPSLADLQALRARLEASGAPMAFWLVEGDEPFDTLPDRTIEWLEAQEGRLVHVAWQEGPETFHVPPVMPEELA